MPKIIVVGQGGRNFAINGGLEAPEGSIIGSVGDLYLRDNSGAGELWQKLIGDKNNTGWGQLAVVANPGSAYVNDVAAGAAGVLPNQYYINIATGGVTKKLT